MIEQRGDRTVADTAEMAALTGRPPYAVRALCERREDGVYDADECTAALKAEEKNPPLLTALEAEIYLGIPANTIYQWVYRGELMVADRVGRRRPRYVLDDLERLEERRRSWLKRSCNNGDPGSR